MDEVSSVVIPQGSNLSEGEWFPNTSGDEEGYLSLPLDASEGGLFSGNFVPPPPRPLFLDDSATPDGLTTCDLCSWAWQQGNAFSLDTAIEAPGEIGWVLTLVIVSLISAVIGAIVMIVVLHCKRLKHASINEAENGTHMTTRRPPVSRPPISTPGDKEISTIAPSNFPNCPNNLNAANGVWSWLSRRSSLGHQLDNLPSAVTENHYTHMEDAYNTVGEALYAELDQDNESTTDRESSSSPAYQNSAYTDPDIQISSAPSSAYYSDLSVTTMPERAYEVVGLATMPLWDNNVENRRHPTIRLAAISESVPSDYV